ncbi:penicillin-binding protein [Burkholderia sp. ABCPW 14]|uniref:peptidoglycan D,D-transpeptidase FtsI family protein n=1 Tax=Burkholderia sp. ABCPW 14 TaxID=1637860 RepID=UPI000770C1D6|nr:penicillin-binding protein 2 [Burkholderia sp. ABCPW 14]KVD74126.1 penicillin-binding protein [Burkholderia sp. ABCPW 14]
MLRSTASLHRGPRGLPRWRSRCIHGLLCAGFAALAVRALWVQVVHSDFYIRQGVKRYEHTFEALPARGRILDRNGGVLAIDEPVADVWIEPDAFRRATRAQMHALASLLRLPGDALAAKAISGRQFLYVKRWVEADLAARIEQLAVPGVHLGRATRRYYPGGSDFAQLVGFVGADGHGLEGVELADDAALSGVGAKRDMIVDRMGRPVDVGDIESAGRPGADIRLSIDRRLQYLARLAVEETIARTAAAAGCAIVVDAKTGEILALVNLPSFDPNGRPAAYDDRFRDRALTDVFEPASTLKPVTVALALSEGVVTPDTRFDTSPGVLQIDGATIHDTGNFGELTVTQIIAKSSNVGMAKIAERLRAQDMWQTFAHAGIGERPLAGMPAIARGTLRPARGWKPIERLTMSYGYGLSMSLAQLADVYTAFAGDGRRIPLSLTHASAPPERVPVVPAAVARQIRAMLETDGAEGTARVARLPDYRIGAKTGTARKLSGKRYARGKYRALFVGMAPMSDPRLIVAVMIDEPSRGSYYGGPAAGPAWAGIMENALHLLGVPPDRSPTRHA